MTLQTEIFKQLGTNNEIAFDINGDNLHIHGVGVSALINLKKNNVSLTTGHGMVQIMFSFYSYDGVFSLFFSLDDFERIEALFNSGL